MSLFNDNPFERKSDDLFDNVSINSNENDNIDTFSKYFLEFDKLITEENTDQNDDIVHPVLKSNSEEDRETFGDEFESANELSFLDVSLAHEYANAEAYKMSNLKKRSEKHENRKVIQKILIYFGIIIVSLIIGVIAIFGFQATLAPVITEECYNIGQMKESVAHHDYWHFFAIRTNAWLTLISFIVGTILAFYRLKTDILGSYKSFKKDAKYCLDEYKENLELLQDDFDYVAIASKDGKVIQHVEFYSYVKKGDLICTINGIQEYRAPKDGIIYFIGKNDGEKVVPGEILFIMIYAKAEEEINEYERN